MRVCVAALCVCALSSLAAAERDAGDAPQQADSELELTEEEKRAWASLHGGGGWGKRGWQDMSSAWGKRGWQDMSSAWGKRGWQDMSSAWGKRGWQDMSSAWGKRAWRDMYQSPWGKRGWQDMSSAWGKRGWQDMSSAWGKRAPEKWANFHGSWGKRAPPALDYPPDFTPALADLLALQQYEADQRTLAEAAEAVAAAAEASRSGAAGDAGYAGAAHKRAWSSLHGAWGKRPVKPANMNSEGSPSQEEA
ncbi:prothoracicostatic peptide isoform X3 [Plutella xylostella]|uniref:prothoracicostatic peptide isoform X3 n=1 Tax=Plutella xylostella TaxID=51655 RepID=UPI002032CCF1|nr:prothoracicostatic peptide isoform X3 [Plutella xylostella]